MPKYVRQRHLMTSSLLMVAVDPFVIVFDHFFRLFKLLSQGITRVDTVFDIDLRKITLEAKRRPICDNFIYWLKRWMINWASSLKNVLSINFWCSGILRLRFPSAGQWRRKCSFFVPLQLLQKPVVFTLRVKVITILCYTGGCRRLVNIEEKWF